MGAQTQRSIQNFPIGNDKVPLELIKAFAIQKKASAISNIAIGKLKSDLGEKIIDVCDEIISGKLDNNFPLSIWQTGSGTQTNMNLNEVIANKANQMLGGALGSYIPIHPNDHCNLGQSSNDSFPTAMHIAVTIKTHKVLIPSVEKLIIILEKKKKTISRCYQNWKNSFTRRHSFIVRTGVLRIFFANIQCFEKNYCFTR